MALVAGVLLTLCFLLSGLTLGVCGLDVKWLQMRTITGTSKQRYDSFVSHWSRLTFPKEKGLDCPAIKAEW
jgi:hypothetical protein